MNRAWKLGATATAAAALLTAGSAQANMEAAEQWVNEEFQPSTLSKEEQMEEMQWFIEAAEPFEGMEIDVVSETLTTHEYESEVLAEAFTEITGIEVNHTVIGEGDVIERLQTQMQSGKNIFDAWVNDADLIGTHFRYDQVVPLSDWMEGEGSEVTNPRLDLDDFIGTWAATAPDGKLYQLPDQQFANLYWFRYDLFQREDLRSQFQEIYGYELGVPKNWSAYEDIAEFFTEHVDEVDGQEMYGHMDYGKRDPSLGWRFTDAWFSMAGAGDTGLPNGRPVDEWGIRMTDCKPRGSRVRRGGATNSPAAVYALEKYNEWLEAYAPPDASGMTFSEAGPVPAEGHVAQQIFWYTAFTASMAKDDIAVTDEDGNPKWRMAPSPHGPYWEEGMKLGYQDVGSWTLLKSTPVERRKAAWLYAQFTTAKTTSLKKTHVGLTPIRDSDIRHESFTERKDELGGLVEFYRSPAREQWTDTGVNVPDYPRLAQLWWQNIAEARTEGTSAQEALDSLAKEQDEVMARLERAGVQGECGPELNELKSREHWLNQPGAPKPQLDNEDPQGETVRYDELVETWQEQQQN